MLISLFAVGLKLGLPFSDRRWRLPVRLAFVSMAVTVALMAAIGAWLGAAAGRGGAARRDPRADRPGAGVGRAGREATTAIGCASA